MNGCFIVGADIGQARDPTALAVIEAVAEEIQVRHLERLPLATPYPDVVGHIVEMVQKLPGAELVVDATGVGRPVVDQLRKAGLSPIAVTITAGKAVTFEDGFWHVPKLVLVRALVVPFESDRLRIANQLTYATALRDELQAFTRKVTGAGRDAYGATAGAHDDLVIAVALAAWWMDMRGGAPRSTTPQDLERCYTTASICKKRSFESVRIDLGESGQ